MTVKIMIDRQFKQALSAENLGALNDLRAGAVNNPGYIGGETLVEVEDGKKITVVSMWSSINDWETWKNSPEREKLEKRISLYIEGPPKIRVFKLGADAFRELFPKRSK
jgi:heme oxygenase (mycobilin-producing)